MFVVDDAAFYVCFKCHLSLTRVRDRLILHYTGTDDSNAGGIL